MYCWFSAGLTNKFEFLIIYTLHILQTCKHSVADVVREDKDEFFWTNQDPQPFQPEYTEEELHVLEAERARREAENEHSYLELYPVTNLIFARFNTKVFLKTSHCTWSKFMNTT